MDFNEHEDQEEHQMDAEEDEIPTVQPPLQGGGYPDSIGLSGSGDGGASAGHKPGGGGGLRYRECLKNHAVGIGGNAVDGCLEFMAAGEEGTLDGLRCAACGCHRNFHRKETAGGTCGGAGGLLYHSQLHHHQYSPYFRAAPSPAGYLHLTAPGHQLQARPLALPSTSREDLEDVSNPSSSGGGGGGRSFGGVMRKRFRTKFTAEQKEKMMGFAEKLGWRIQKHDEAAVEEFCSETGVRRQVLKVWMHNNKHAHDDMKISELNLGR